MLKILFYDASLNYIELIILASAVNGCIWISTFASLIGIPVGITSSAIKLKISAITAGIKMYKSIIKKHDNKKKKTRTNNKKKHDKIVLLAKPKLNIIKFLIPKALIDSNTSHDEFVLINNVLKEYEDMEKQIKI